MLKPTYKSSKVYKKSDKNDEITVTTHANQKIVRIPNSEIRGKTKASTTRRVAAKVAEISNSPVKRSFKFSNPDYMDESSDDESDEETEGYSYEDFYNDYLNIVFFEKNDIKYAKFLKEMFKTRSSKSDY